MPVSIPDFWKLLVASRLAASSSVPKLQEQFSQVKGADTQGNSTTLAQWLISQGVLSKYQAKVLLAGHAGPFIYGEYTVYDRLSSGRLQGAFRAIHPPTRVRVTLSFHSGAAVQNAQWWSIVVDQIGKLAQAVHPNLARVYHLVDLGQFKFTSIEELQGESAGERLAKGPLPWGPACRMMRQVAAGLTKLLDTGQLHGAVRPSNVWINAEENAKLLLPPLRARSVGDSWTDRFIGLASFRRTVAASRLPGAGAGANRPGPRCALGSLRAGLHAVSFAGPAAAVYWARPALETRQPRGRKNSHDRSTRRAADSQSSAGRHVGERSGAAVSASPTGGRRTGTSAGEIRTRSVEVARLADAEQITGIRSVDSALHRGGRFAESITRRTSRCRPFSRPA